MTTFSDLKNAVSEISTVRASVVHVIEQLIARIELDLNAPTQDDVQGLLEALMAERGALADAVVRGTAAAGELEPVAEASLLADVPAIADPVLTAEEAEQVETVAAVSTDETPELPTAA